MSTYEYVQIELAPLSMPVFFNFENRSIIKGDNPKNVKQSQISFLHHNMRSFDPGINFQKNTKFLDFPDNFDRGCISRIFLEETVESYVAILLYNGMIVAKNKSTQ